MARCGTAGQSGRVSPLCTIAPALRHAELQLAQVGSLFLASFSARTQTFKRCKVRQFKAGEVVLTPRAAKRTFIVVIEGLVGGQHSSGSTLHRASASMHTLCAQNTLNH